MLQVNLYSAVMVVVLVKMVLPQAAEAEPRLVEHPGQVPVVKCGF